MGIGLSIPELQQLFQSQLSKSFGEGNLGKGKAVSELKERGITQSTAEVEVYTQNELHAAMVAMLSIIDANNRKIEAQLRAKGIRL